MYNTIQYNTIQYNLKTDLTTATTRVGLVLCQWGSLTEISKYLLFRDKYMSFLTFIQVPVCYNKTIAAVSKAA